MSIRELNRYFEILIGAQLIDAAINEVEQLVLLFQQTIEPGASYREWKMIVGNTYTCAWRLETDTTFLCGTSDLIDQQKLALKSVLNLRIANVIISPQSLETRLIFQGGITLWIFPVVYLQDNIFLTLIDFAGHETEINSKR